MSDVIYSNIRDLNRRLDRLDTGLKRELQKEAKRPAKKVQSAIVAAIPLESPRRGMNSHRGRTSWNNSVNYKGQLVPPKSVSINFKSGGSKRADITSLVRVTVNSPAVAIVDMAANFKSKRGEIFVRGLGGRPSRYVWPAANSSLPEVQAEVRMVLEKYQTIAGRYF